MAEKSLLLQILDHLWKEHLLHLDHLRQGIHLRGYAQRDPLNEYKREAFDLFEAMLTNLRQTVTQVLSHLEIRMQEPEPTAAATPVPGRRHRATRATAPMAMAGGDDSGDRPGRSVDLGQGAAQRALPLRLRPEVQAVPRADRLTRPSAPVGNPMNPIAMLLLLAMLATAGVLYRRAGRLLSAAGSSTSATATG